MRFFLIHGTGGGPSECWYPWLAKILEEKGHEVIAPHFPTPSNQNLQSWLKTFGPYWEKVDENTVLIGRSIGVPFVLRLLERSPVKIKAAFLVAGFYTDLRLPQFFDVVNSFIVDPFKWEKIKNSSEKFFVYNSDNDPLISLEKGAELAEKLGVKLRVVHGAEHIWFDTFPEILQGIESV